MIIITEETKETCRILCEFYGVSMAILIDMMLQTFIMTHVMIIDKKRFLWFVSPMADHVVYVPTLSSLLFPPKEGGRIDNVLSELTLPRPMMSMFKKAQKLSMLPNLGQAFMSAVELTYRITELQLQYPEYLLTTAVCGKESYLVTQLKLDVNAALEKRGLYIVRDEKGGYNLVRNKTLRDK